MCLSDLYVQGFNDTLVERERDRIEESLPSPMTDIQASNCASRGHRMHDGQGFASEVAGLVPFLEDQTPND